MAVYHSSARPAARVGVEADAASHEADPLKPALTLTRARQMLGEGLPECAPKPSIAASACARSAKCALMSSNRARFCSLGSAANDRSASFSSLFNAPARRCKARLCLSTCSASEDAASALRHHQLGILAASAR